MTDAEENRHFKQVVSAFFNYNSDSLQDINRMNRDFTTLEKSGYTKYFNFNWKTDRVDKLK